jgi:hypothetical protein
MAPIIKTKYNDFGKAFKAIDKAVNTDKNGEMTFDAKKYDFSKMSPELKNNKEFWCKLLVKAALMVAFEYAAKEIRNNPDFVCEQVEKHGGIFFKYAGDEIKRNPKAVASMVVKGGKGKQFDKDWQPINDYDTSALQYANLEAMALEDEELCMLIVLEKTQDGKDIKYATYRFKTNEDSMLRVIDKTSVQALAVLKEEGIDLINQKDFMLEVAKETGDPALKDYLGPDLKDDPFMVAVTEGNAEENKKMAEKLIEREQEGELTTEEAKEIVEEVKEDEGAVSRTEEDKKIEAKEDKVQEEETKTEETTTKTDESEKVEDAEKVEEVAEEVKEAEKNQEEISEETKEDIKEMTPEQVREVEEKAEMAPMTLEEELQQEEQAPVYRPGGNN